MSALTTIKTKAGIPFTVGSSYADRFTGLLNDLEAAGYGIKADQSGGYNYRNIAGTNKLSNHAHGAAVDVNWGANARGTAGDIPPELARSLASKYGLTWGGDWKNPDPMHFEVAGNVQPIQSGPTDPGYVPPDYDPAAPSVANGNAPAAPANDIESIIAQLSGTGQGQDQGGGSQDALASLMKSLGESDMGPLQMAQPRPVDVSHLRQAILRRQGLA